MTYGFVTIATGNKTYYKMARNLCVSAKINNNAKFAIITDRNNTYTDIFDDVIIMDNPYNSWLDKLELFQYAPYDRNLFIEADCLVYGNLDYFWKKLENEKFSCFGRKLPLNDIKNGWFSLDGIGEYRDKVHYIPSLHGGLYYIEKSFANDFYQLCKEILTNYKKYTFTMFDQPADEPIVALAAAIMNVNFIEWGSVPGVCVFPLCNIKDIAILETNGVPNGIRTKIRGGGQRNDRILHFGNSNTKKAFYKTEVKRFNMYIEGKKFSARKKGWYYKLYTLVDVVQTGQAKVKWYWCALKRRCNIK